MAKTPLTFAHLFDAPWYVTQEKFNEIRAFVQARMNGQSISFESGEGGATMADPLRKQKQSTGQQPGVVAIIPAYGTLVKRGAGLDDSGQTGYVALERHLRLAANDPEVSAIVLDIDSPGGMADGVQGLTRLIREIDADQKPVIAFANGLTASAGYYLATGARAIVATEDAHIGSIGVRMVHVDFSKAAEDAGFTFTDLFVGEYKVAGTPHQKLSERDRGYIQDHLNDAYTRFISDVAIGRGITQAVALQWGDGRVFNSDVALKMGMIDQIGTLTDAISVAMGETTMNREELKANHPDLFNEVFDLGKSEGSEEKEAAISTAVTEALGAEQERCAQLQKIGGPAEMLSAAISEGTQPGEYAQAVLAHERENPQQTTQAADPLKGATAAASVKVEGKDHGDDKPADFMGAVNAYAEEHDCSRAAATRAVKREQPELHAKYLKDLRSK